MSAPSNNKNNNRNSTVPNGQYLRQLRGQLGLTQNELAFRLNVSERLVRKAEQSQRIECRSLVLFQMFFEQQGLAVDSEAIGHGWNLSSKQMSVAFFRTCLVQGDLNSILERCHEQVSAKIDGTVAVGHNDVKALFQSFEKSSSMGMKWIIGPVLSESNTTSIFWSWTSGDQSSTPQGRTKSTVQKGVVLIRGGKQVESFELFIFRCSAQEANSP